MPPSRRRAGYQPVIEIVRTLGAHIGNAVSTETVTKIKETPELKKHSKWNSTQSSQ